MKPEEVTVTQYVFELPTKAFPELTLRIVAEDEATARVMIIETLEEALVMAREDE